MQINTHHFDQASPEHTEKVFEVVKTFLDQNPEIYQIVVATTTGETGVAASKVFADKEVIVVAHHTGFSVPDENELTKENREVIEASHAKLLITTHAFAGVARGFRKDVGTWTPVELTAVVYRTFGQGTKVCAEITLMAADAGLVRTDKDVICIAGTGFGADTAWLVRPANTNRFPHLKMKACLCKPLHY